MTSAVLYFNSQNLIIATFKAHQFLHLGKTNNLMPHDHNLFLKCTDNLVFPIWEQISDTFLIKFRAFFSMFGLNDVMLEEIWPSLCFLHHLKPVIFPSQSFNVTHPASPFAPKKANL